MKKVTYLSLLVCFLLGIPYTANAQGVLARLNQRIADLETKLQEAETARSRELQQLKRQLGQNTPAASGAVQQEVEELAKRLDEVQTTVLAQNNVTDRVDQLEHDMAQAQNGPVTEMRSLIDELRTLVKQNVAPQESTQQKPATMPATTPSQPVRDIVVGGQIRPRFEARDRGTNNYNMATTMRVRTHVSAKLNDNVNVFMQVQDVRTWGEETNTLGDFSADNFDLHQGYFELKNIKNTSFSLKAGRQAIAFGGQRLIGAVEWTQQGRVFDGLRLTTASSGGKLDLIGIKLAEASVASVANDAYLFGAYGQITQPKDVDIDLYGLYNRVTGAANTDQYTIGTRLMGKQSTWDYRFEASYQTGKRAGQDVEAYMFGGRMGATFAKGKSKVTLWYDYLSGDDDLTDNKTKVFDTLFATNHKFYGFADLFLNLPVHTAGRGLQNLALKMLFKPKPNVSLGIDLHAFWLAENTGITSRRLGEEADFTLTYRYSPEVTFVGGLSYVVARDGFAQIGRLTQDVGFGYLMTNVAF